MTQSQPLRLQAKRANRVAGWLLAVPVGFLWLLAITFAFLSLAALSQIGVKEPMDLFGFGAFALVIGLICLLASLLTGKVHDALAIYEFTPQDVSKRSPFREQRANWSEVAG
jgi:fatty acid desaturase